MWRLALVACLLAVPAIPAQTTSTSGYPPLCTITSPSPSLIVPLGSNQTFVATCTDRDADLFWLEWSRDDGKGFAQSPARPTPETNRSHTYSTTFTFTVAGAHWVRAVGIDRANHRGEAIEWTIQVTDSRRPRTSLDPKEEGSWLLPIDPVGAFSALVGAVVGVGGLVLGFVQLRKRRRGTADGEGEEEGGGAGSASALQVTQAVQSNSGTVVGSAGTVIVQAPAAPTPAPTVPPGVPARRHALYLALDEARDVLDVPAAGADAINARDLVQGLLEDLRDGRTPLAAARDSAATAIDQALRGPHPRIQGGAAALRRAADELRR